MRVVSEAVLAAIFVGSTIAPALAGEAPSPPTTEEAQAAYSRFLVAFVGRLGDAGLPGALAGDRMTQIQRFAARQPLRGCDEWQEPRMDPFAPADAPKPAIVFNCAWESGERISLTKVPNTGSWVVSDDASSAAAAGILLTGPKQQTPQVVAVPVKPPEPAVEEAPVAAQSAPAAAGSAGAAPHGPSFYSGANLQAMPSPFVPPARTEPARSSNSGPATVGPMPTPFGRTSN